MDKVYPHIAARDAEEGVNTNWLLSLNEANYRFRWGCGAWGLIWGWAKRGSGGALSASTLSCLVRLHCLTSLPHSAVS